MQCIDATGCAAAYAATPATPVSGSWRECEAQKSQQVIPRMAIGNELQEGVTIRLVELEPLDVLADGDEVYGEATIAHLSRQITSTSEALGSVLFPPKALMN